METISLAAMAKAADRTHTAMWIKNLDKAVFDYWIIFR